MKHKELTTQLRCLEQAKTEIVQAGDVLPGHWIDSAKARGKTYYRLRRWSEGKAAYVRRLQPEEVATIRIACERGQRLEQIHQEFQQVKAQLDKLVSVAAALGVSVKNPYGDRDATPEWYTPPEYIGLARQVLGTIDLDPASNATAQAWIQAGHFYTKEDDGLSQPWFGRVWCNPPYGSPEVRLMARSFLEKAIASDQKGELQAAVFLLNRTGASWYKDCLQRVHAVCEVKRRIAFIDAKGVRQPSPPTTMISCT